MYLAFPNMSFAIGTALLLRSVVSTLIYVGQQSSGWRKHVVYTLHCICVKTPLECGRKTFRSGPTRTV